MGTFQPAFNALFSGGLVEQCIAIVQNNQAAAIAAYSNQSPYGALDQITDFHKAKVAAPQYPCCTIVAGDAQFDEEQPPWLRKYRVSIFVHLDLSYTDPDQLADWSYHYARLLDQIFSTVTCGLSSMAVFESAQSISWPDGIEARQTQPFASGTVKLLAISAAHIGLVPGEESATPVQRISLALDFEMAET